MSRPRYQRSLPGGAYGNGMDDGWRRPDGAAPPAGGNSRANLYCQRGQSLACRYWVFWSVSDIHHRTDLRCSFDSLEAALEEIASHPDVLSGGVWDRHKKRWAF